VCRRADGDECPARHKSSDHGTSGGPVRGQAGTGDTQLQGRGRPDPRHHVVPQRAPGRHRQRESDVTPDAAAERAAVLSEDRPQGQPVGRRRVPLQRHQPADRCQRRQQERHATDSRYIASRVGVKQYCYCFLWPKASPIPRARENYYYYYYYYYY